MELFKICFAVLVVSSATLALPGDNYWGLTGHGYSSKFAYPNYSFDYGVHSPHTGDVKNHHETRHGDVVRGSYSLHDADGTIRQVDYVADKHNGFNAVVKKIGHAVHPPTEVVRHHHQPHHQLGGGAGAHFDGGFYGAGAHLGGGLYGGEAFDHGDFGFYGGGLSGGKYYAFASKSAGHLGGGLHHGGGHLGGATSYANGNNLSVKHYGVARYAAGHYGDLGTSSFGHGHSYSIKHFGSGGHGGHFGGATSYANGNSFSLSHLDGHHH